MIFDVTTQLCGHNHETLIWEVTRSFQLSTQTFYGREANVTCLFVNRGSIADVCIYPQENMDVAYWVFCRNTAKGWLSWPRSGLTGATGVIVPNSRSSRVTTESSLSVRTSGLRLERTYESFLRNQFKIGSTRKAVSFTTVTFVQDNRAAITLR